MHGGVCLYCKKPVAHADLTLDHIEAKANGGSTTIQNLAVACKPCNAAKGDRPIEAFRPKAGAEWLQALMQQVDDRLRRLNPSITAPVPSALNPPLPHPPKRGAAAGP